MENGNTSKKKSKKKKIRNSSPQASNGSDKQNYFCGFSSRTVRNICEQVDNTEVQPEVFNVLAEDATYKLMEIINNIKNYSKHSGGKATFDITNAVLQDSNCSPIVGADNQAWESIEDDHKQLIYFNRDDTLDLTEEFNRHITEENVNGPIFLTSSFLLDEKIDEDYMDFYFNICDSIFTGDEECLNFALNILSENPHVAGLVKHFLAKWIDMIAVNYSNNILERSIKLLAAIIRNPYTGNSDMNMELKHICQLLVNLLVGSFSDEHEIRENGHDNELEPETYSTYDSNIVSYENNNGISLDEMSSDSNMKAFDENSGVMMENFVMPESEKSGRTLKDELLEGFVINDGSSRMKMLNDEETSKDSTSSKSIGGRNDIEDDYNALLSTNCASTLKCNDIHVEAICELMGMCAAKWSGVEQYLTILIISEVENLFKIIKKIKTKSEYELFGRVARALWSIGEFAFRELLVFFDRTDLKNVAAIDSLSNNLNFSAIYVRGKNDIFFYEYLQEVCGDKVLPYLIYYANYILKQNHRRQKKFEVEKFDVTRFKVFTKVRLLKIRRPRLVPTVQRLPPPPLKANRPIVIHYGHPSTKKIKRAPTKTEDKRHVEIDENNLKSFNQNIVIAKGKLKKPLTNQYKRNFFDNFHTMLL